MILQKNQLIKMRKTRINFQKNISKNLNLIGTGIINNESLW